MPLPLKKLLIKVLASVFTFFIIFKKIVVPILRVLTPAIRLTGRILFKIFIPSYDLYLQGKRIFLKFYCPLIAKHRLIHPFSRRYITHAVIVAISLLVVTANLNANEVKKDELIYMNVMTAVIDQEIPENFQEGPLETDSKKITRYLGSSFLSPQPQISYDPY